MIETCKTCDHLCGDYCTRYPRWILLNDPKKHWCGEYKKEVVEVAE